jgi:ethanolamine utilization protein EutP (predicted NTPase)
VLALTKVDAAPEGYAEDVRDALQTAGAGAVTTLSSVSGAGVRDLLRQLMRTIESARAAETAPQEPVPWSP